MKVKLREIKLFFIILNLIFMATLFSVHSSLLFIKQSKLIYSYQNNFKDLPILSSTFISTIIDDLGGGDYTWEEAANQDWCSGSGTLLDPYIIEGHIWNMSKSMDGLKINNSHNKYFIIKDCTFKWNEITNTMIMTGIYLRNTTHGQIIDNLAYHLGYGIVLEDCENINLTGNTVYDHLNAISILNSNITSVIENTVFDNDEGIHVEYSNNNTIVRNNASYNADFGLMIVNSHNNSISENIVSSNTQDGVYLSNSMLNTISENTIQNNYDGIYVYVSDYNVIHDNIINSNNNRGVYLDDGDDSSDNNLVYRNFFIDNIIHAVNDTYTTNNNWNNTEIGNYWDNYTGLDGNHDGIGDDPHYFNGGIDYLPIVDDSPPSIIIDIPNPGDVFGHNAPDFVISITEEYLHFMWYTLDDGLNNYTFSDFTGTIEQSAWDNVYDGTNTLKFYAKDKPGNIGFREINVIKDTEDPAIIINSPNMGDKFGKKAPSFNLTVTDNNLDIIWYSLEGSLTNYTTNTTGIIDQAAWSTLPKGSVKIIFYAKDKAGNIAFEEVSVEKTKPSVIIGLDLFITNILISLIIAVSIIGIITKIYHKKRISTE